jgi:predicted CopG family antitoxin
MVAPKTVTLSDDVYDRMRQEAEAEGKTVDELTGEAVQRHLARRWLERTGREAQVRRGNMTDEQVEVVVEKAIQESRAEQRGR